MRRLLALLVLPTLVMAEDNGVEVDTSTGLAIAPGWQQVRAHCGGCHSHAIVISQRADQQTWVDIIRWMQATQNLWQLQPNVEEQIVEYLATNYPPRASRRRAPIPPSLRPRIQKTIQ